METHRNLEEHTAEHLTHRDLGLLDLLDLPPGGGQRAGGLWGETRGIVKTLLGVKARLHHHHLPLATSCVSVVGKTLALSLWQRRASGRASERSRVGGRGEEQISVCDPPHRCSLHICSEIHEKVVLEIQPEEPRMM